MRIANAINIDDVRAMARNRLPRIVFDFIDGGVEGELCLARNREAFQTYGLLPRYCRDIAVRDQSVTLFGTRHESPLGISPAGTAGLFWPHADRLLPEKAARARIPFVMSSASGLAVEDAAAISTDQVWFQIYATRDESIVLDQVRRAVDCEIRVLVLTVDVPVVPKRERNLRNGYVRPLRMTPRRVFEGLTHPAWLTRFLRAGGIPPFANWRDYAGTNAASDEIADLFSANTPAPGLQWDFVERLRKLWPRTLVVKGIMHPGDAVRAAAIGADGIVISNHGGRQFDCVPSPLDMVSEIVAATGQNCTIMIDSGIRRGSDVLVTRALGAQFAFFARPTLYGVAAAGSIVRKVIDIVRDEIDLAMTQLGCAGLDDLATDRLVSNGQAATVART